MTPSVTPVVLNVVISSKQSDIPSASPFTKAASTQTNNSQSALSNLSMSSKVLIAVVVSFVGFICLASMLAVYRHYKRANNVKDVDVGVERFYTNYAVETTNINGSNPNYNIFETDRSNTPATPR